MEYIELNTGDKMDAVTYFNVLNFLERKYSFSQKYGKEAAKAAFTGWPCRDYDKEIYSIAQVTGQHKTIKNLFDLSEEEFLDLHDVLGAYWSRNHKK